MAGHDIAADLPRVDIAYQLNAFDTPAAQKDANGYPVAGVNGRSSTDLGFVLATGTYKISYVGSGTLNVSGTAHLTGSWQLVNGVQQNEVQITGTPGNFGNFVTLDVVNAAGQTVQDIHILYPGYAYGATEVFLPQFLNLLKPFRALRFMDWEATNGNTIVNWADRPNAAHFGHSGFGEPYEHIVELINQTGKDLWVTIPEHASDDFTLHLADFIRDHLDFSRINAARAAQGLTTPFEVILETSNETWNSGFSVNATFKSAANANPTLYTGTYSGTVGPSWMSGNSDLMKVGQYEADRLVKQATIFRTEFGTIGKSSAIAPVLSGWALGAVYSDVGLKFIQAHYGDPKDYVKYVALAPYFGADDSASGDLASLFTGLNANIQSMDAAFNDFKALSTQYGIKIAGYEGGQGLTGTTNQSIKHLAQHDKRMYDTYNAYFAFWKAHFGESLFMHFSLAGDPGIPEFIYQYGYWSSIIGVLEDTSACEQNLVNLAGNESVSSVVHHCPKYKSLVEQVP